MKIRRTIEIQAQPEVVWRSSVDVERWPEWSPGFQSIKRLDDGPFGVGSRALIKQPGLPEALWTVTSLTPMQEFTWETRVRGIGMVATHEIGRADQDVENTLILELSGFVAWTTWPLIRRSLATALEKENVALKNECENRRN